VRETLFLRWRDPALDVPCAYALGDADGSLVELREAPLREALALAAGRRIVVFVPGADVRLTQVKVPSRQAAKVLQAAPYLLEEQFAEDVETLHFALGPRAADGSYPIAAVAKERMERWLAPLREQNLTPDWLVPETLALPWDEAAAWAVLPEPSQVTARTGAYAGFSCLPEDFELFLQLAENGTPHALRVLVVQGSSADYTRLQRPLELLPGYTHPLEALARHWRAARSINLLQGAYSPRETLQRYWRQWRVAAALLATVFLLGVAVNGVEAIRLKRELAAQEAANEARFHQLFPSEVRVVDMQAQAERQLALAREGGAASNLFLLLQQTAESLSATPGLTLKTLEYRDGALLLDLAGSDLQVLEKLRGWFAMHPGVNLEVQTADAGENGVQIRLKLSVAKRIS
jgi:general secretion pathway protein L